MTHPKMIWPCINYRDALGAIDFLERAFGFVENAVYKTGDHVEHAELLFPEGGGIMLGSAKDDGSPFKRLPTGGAGVYVVTDHPDALYRSAQAAGARVISELKDESWGQRGFTVSDPEGNLWSFGTYRGEVK